MLQIFLRVMKRPKLLPEQTASTWQITLGPYWIPKINRNVERDIENQKKLTDMGWKVLIVWECELKKTSQKERLEKLCNEIIS